MSNGEDVAERLEDVLTLISPDHVLRNEFLASGTVDACDQLLQQWFRTLATRRKAFGLSAEVFPRPADTATSASTRARRAGKRKLASDELIATPVPPRPARYARESHTRAPRVPITTEVQPPSALEPIATPALSALSARKVELFVQKLVKGFNESPVSAGYYLELWEVKNPSNNPLKRLTQVSETVCATAEGPLKRLKILFFAQAVDSFEPSEKGKRGHRKSSTALDVIAQHSGIDRAVLATTYGRKQPYLLLAESCGLTSLLAPVGITEIENFNVGEIKSIPKYLTANDKTNLLSKDRCRSVAQMLLQGFEFYGWTRSELARGGKGIMTLIGNYIDLKNLTEDRIPYREVVGTARIKCEPPRSNKAKQKQTREPVERGMRLAIAAYEGEGSSGILSSDPRIHEYCPQAETSGLSSNWVNPTSGTVGSPDENLPRTMLLGHIRGDATLLDDHLFGDIDTIDHVGEVLLSWESTGMRAL